MVKYKIIQKPAFDVIGKKTWISGQNNELFGQFWALNGRQPGRHTNSALLGISCVENDPTNRAFYYMIAIEKPETPSEDLESYHVPASQWAVFACVGKVPEAIVKSEIYAFTEWLPTSDYEHAKAPEMEVYFPGNDGASEDSYCEFWLPITNKSKVVVEQP
jgi:AraC family transcriptional regulator